MVMAAGARPKADRRGNSRIHGAKPRPGRGDRRQRPRAMRSFSVAWRRSGWDCAASIARCDSHRMLCPTASSVESLERLAAAGAGSGDKQLAFVRAGLVRALDRLWSINRGFTPGRSPEDILLEKIQTLSPKDDSQRALKSVALTLTSDFARTRWQQYEEVNRSITPPVLVVLISWLPLSSSASVCLPVAMGQ
jgi:hypothetical protein